MQREGRSTPNAGELLRPSLLLLLKESPAHGYDLLARLAALGITPDTGHLYRTLRSLEEEGLVKSAWDGSTGQGRRGYQLTKAGDQWLRQQALTVAGNRRQLDVFLERYQQAAGIRLNGGRSMATKERMVAKDSAQEGMLRFIHYSFMPNRLGYCGPDQNNLLLQYGVAGEVDKGLPPVLTKFLGPLPYLRTIASAAGINDIFDDRVVEAYWIGNSLLDHINAKELHSALRARFSRELPPKLMEMVAGKVPQGARPHHSFHVFDVWRQVGRLEGNVVATMDNCRISWGRVTAVNGPNVVVDREPLIMRDGKLAIGPPTAMSAQRLVEGKGFVDKLSRGDLVTLHWGLVCERISEPQQRALERYTRYHLAIANQTI